VYTYSGNRKQHSFNFLGDNPEKGKLIERLGRKATGLIPQLSGYGGWVAEAKDVPILSIFIYSKGSRGWVLCF